MRVRHLGRRLRESFLPLIIISVFFELIVVGEYVNFGMLFAVVNAAAFLCYTVWFITCLIKSRKEITHRKTYYTTNGIVLALISVLSITLSLYYTDPFYYFLFCPFAFLQIASITSVLVSNLLSLAVLFACYFIVPLTVKRKKKRHRHGSGPVDTNNFIMRS